jgi:hypothetical protein
MSQDEALHSALRARFSLLGLQPTEADLEKMLPFAIDLDAAAARLRVARSFDQAPTIGPIPSDGKARPDV